MDTIWTQSQIECFVTNLTGGQNIRRMVRLAGLEPAAPSFGNWYSIHLSYRRIFECFGTERSLDQLAIIRTLICDY